MFTLSLLLGLLMAAAGTWHMANKLTLALENPTAASKIISQGYLIRYLVAAVVLIGLSLTEWLNPLYAFLGLMTLKLTAYLQPFTHKVFLTIFHEVEEPGQPMSDEDWGADNPDIYPFKRKKKKKQANNKGGD